MANPFATGLEKFKRARAQHWTPQRQMATYGALSLAGLGGLAVSIIGGDPYLTGASLGTLARTGSKGYKAFQAWQRSRAAKLPLGDISQSTRNSPEALQALHGRNAVLGLSDSELLEFHRGVRAALDGMGRTTTAPPSLPPEGSAEMRGYDVASALGVHRGPKMVESYCAGVAEVAEERNLRLPDAPESAGGTRALPPPRRTQAGPASGGGGGGTIGSLIQALEAAADAATGAASDLSRFNERFSEHLEASGELLAGTVTDTGDDLVDIFQVAGQGTDAAIDALTHAAERLRDHASRL